ncbi:MAG: hypothetical protein U0031_17495 [Thermomicrobiales bacterium]
MSSRLRVLHEWVRQVEGLLPEARVTRSRVLALFAAGVLWANSVTLLKVAAKLPLAVTDPSTERRLRRFLANPAVTVAELWDPLLPALLRGLGPREVVLVFDPTPYRGDATVLVVGVVVRHRVLPLRWQVMPQQTSWPERLAPVLSAMLQAVVAALPPDTTATLLADRGLIGAGIVDAARAAGIPLVLRLRAGAAEETRVRLDGGPDQRLAELPTRPGQRLAVPAAIFKEAGWREGFLTIHWDRAEPEPWVLFSDRPAGAARVREYRKRTRAEATYQDEKSRGFALEASKVTALDRIERLLLPVHLALWWAYGLGLQAVRAGQRRRYDRPDRRDLSLVRLGQTACTDALDRGHRPPLPFRSTPIGWTFRWLT